MLAPFEPSDSPGCKNALSSFASSYAEEASETEEAFASRLAARPDGAVLGAFEAEALLGVVGVYREPMLKLAHKSNLWGMYVTAPARQTGVGRALLSEALSFAARKLCARQVNLGVNASNSAANRLYELLGFRQFGFEHGFMRLDGVSQDEVHMVCHLHSET